MLSLRGAEHGFHWNIFVPTDKPKGEIWHAVNRSGGWSLEIERTMGIPYLMSLCVALKLGTVTSGNWEILRTTLANVPGSGQASSNTGEAFTCRVWVKDAVLALHNAEVILLKRSIEGIEKAAVEAGESHRAFIERGTQPAKVENSTGFSATA